MTNGFPLASLAFRWTIVPLYWPLFTYPRKFATFCGATVGKSSMGMFPSGVAMVTIGSVTAGSAKCAFRSIIVGAEFCVTFRLEMGEVSVALSRVRRSRASITPRAAARIGLGAAFENTFMAKAPQFDPPQQYITSPAAGARPHLAMDG